MASCSHTPKQRQYSPLLDAHDTTTDATTPTSKGNDPSSDPNDPAATIIQRLYKRHRLVFGQLGPNIFARKGGGDADCGTLYFPAANAKAPFITVSDTTSTSLFANFMEKHWKDFELSPKLQVAFDRGLVAAATTTNAWVVTGGTDTGCMKLVAAAFHRHTVSVPLIGVVSYGCVKGREIFDAKKRGLQSTYLCNEKAGADGAPLNPYHTHFVFCDNGKVAPQAWGGEIGLRADLESTYATSKGVPMVLLVVQGGPGTLQTVATVAALRRAVLIVRGTGGAADAIADYVLTGETSDPKFQSEKLQQTLARIRQLHAASGERVITLFSLGDKVEMSTMLLRALIKVLLSPPPMTTTDDDERRSLPPSPGGAPSPSHSPWTTPLSRQRHVASDEMLAEQKTRALVLAVNWNRLDIARNLLEDMSADRRFTKGHQVALQFMLEKRRYELFKVIAESPAFTIAYVNITRLYLTTQHNDKYGVLLSDAPLQHRFAERVKEIVVVHRDPLNRDRPLNTPQLYFLYQEVVGPFLASFTQEAMRAIKSAHEPQYRDLFLWAVLMGEDEFAFEFWRRTENPVRTALWGACVSRGMAQRTQVCVHEWITRAEMFEEWATGMLGVIPTQASAHLILSSAVEAWGPNTLIDMAMQVEMKSFLAHRHCQSLMDVVWRGGGAPGKSAITLSEDWGDLALWAATLVPLFNPYLYQSRTSNAAESVRDISSIAGGVMHTYRLAKGEIVRAGGVVQSTTPFGQISNRMASIIADAGIDMNDHCLLSDDSNGLREGVPSPGSSSIAKGDASASATTAANGVGSGSSQPDGFPDVKELRIRIGAFYSIPRVKFILRTAAHLVMIANYTMLLFALPTIIEVSETGVPAIMIEEYVFFFQAFANFADQAHQSMLLGKRRVSKLANFGALLNFGDLLLVFAFVVRLLSVSSAMRAEERHGQDVLLYVVAQVTLSVDVIIIMLRTVTFRSISMKFGVLVIMVEQMAYDLVIFIELFSLIMLGFCLCFIGLASWAVEDAEEGESGTPGNMPVVEALSPDGGPSASGRLLQALTHGRRLRGGGGGGYTVKDGAAVPWHEAVYVAFWGIFGEVDREYFDSHVPLGTPILFIWVVVSSIALVNLLVAMFADTYQKIMDKSEIEYKFIKYNRIFLYNEIVLSVPPPFNVLSVLQDLVHYACTAKASHWKSVDLERVCKLDAGGKGEDSDHHVASSAYMESYLRTRDEEEASTMHGISATTRDLVRTLEQEQTRQADVLCDIQAELAQQRDAHTEQMRRVADVLERSAHLLERLDAPGDVATTVTSKPINGVSTTTTTDAESLTDIYGTSEPLSRTLSLSRRAKLQL